jgi:hypothetical protein
MVHHDRCTRSLEHARPGRWDGGSPPARSTSQHEDGLHAAAVRSGLVAEGEHQTADEIFDGDHLGSERHTLVASDRDTDA